MAIFITADQHWGHANILQSCHRKYRCVEEHDAELICAWNKAVGSDDVVYHLGDVTLRNAAFASDIFRQLNGQIHVLGYPWHHDARWLKTPLSARGGRVTIEPAMVVLEHIIKSGEHWLPVVLCHYPFEVWDRKHYGAVHLHGHTHGTLQQIPNRLDVGVDVALLLLGDYRPFCLVEAMQFAMNKASDGNQ